MKITLTLAAAAAALLAGTSAFAQTATSVATTGDGATTATTVASTAPTTKVVSENGDKVSETVTTAPIQSNGPVQTATTVRAADGQALVQTTVAADGTASTAVNSNVPVKRKVEYRNGQKIETTKTKVVTDAPVNVVTTSNTADGQATAVSTTATPDGNAAAVAPAVSTVAAVPAAAAPMETATAAPVATTNLASFDTNNDGQLTPLEFGQMVLASQAPASGAPAISSTQRYSKRAANPATSVLNQTAGAFGKADTNGDHLVSSAELAAWQAAGSPM